MSQSWIEVTAGAQKARHSLRAGLTRVGGAGCEVQVEGSAGDELHFWDQPAKLIHVGDATTPLLNGRMFGESAISNGDTVQWASSVIVYGCDQPVVIEELEGEPPGPPGPEVDQPSETAQTSGERAWARMRAGMLVELGLADRKTAKRWQGSVLQGEFDADACAREILAASAVAADDQRILERAGRLERDLLMAPFRKGIKGASRRARGAARGGAAFLLANLIAILAYTLILLAIVLLLRVNRDFSFDGMIDRWLEALSGAPAE